MKFLDEIESVCDTQPDSWQFYPEAPGYNAVLYYHHENGVVAADELRSIDEEYTIHKIMSASNGRTSSSLEIYIKDTYLNK